MTGGFLSVLMMRPNRCWTVLHVSILAGLLFTLNADSEDSKCETEIKVRRNTVYEASTGQDLRINCTVTFCNNSPPTVFWYKLGKNVLPVNVSGDSHIKTNWTLLTRSEGILFLSFKNILSNDSGQYRCQSGDSVSHAINISVYDGKVNTVTENNYTPTTTLTSTLAPNPDTPWMYVYTASGIVGFVIVVIIISVISMQGCKGKSKKETQTDTQYMEIPIVVQPSSLPPPRGSPSAPPSRRSTRRKPPNEQPTEMQTLSRDDEQLYSKIRGDRQRQRNAVEEEASSVVYAALNHQLPPRTAARPLRPQEEYSEYAAIRVP